MTGTGNLTGLVNSNGTSVNINPTPAAATTLTVGQISATTGNAAALVSTANGSLLSIPVGSEIQTTAASGLDVSLAGATVTNNGTVSSNRDADIQTSLLNGSGTLTTVRDINISTIATGSPLQVNMPGGTLTGGRNVNFDLLPTAVPGQINVSVGTISATNGTGLVQFNPGAHTVTVNATSIKGLVEDPNYTTTPSDSVNVTVNSAAIPLQIGKFAATTNASSTFNATNSAAGGSITTVGAITANGTAASPVTFSADTVTNNNAVTAKTSDLVVSSSAPGRLLTLAMTGGSLTASKANVDLNGTTSAAAGAVTITGTGTIVADGSSGSNGIVNLNIGSGKGTVAATSILGDVVDPNYSTVPSDSVSITVTANSALGALQVGNFNATANASSSFTASNTKAGGGVTTSGPITANGAAANLVTLSADNVINNFAVTSNTSDLVVKSHAAGTLLTLAMNSSGSLTASNANVDLNGTTAAAAAPVTITGTGNIVADGSSGTNGIVNLNVGAGKGTVAANSIFGAVEDPNYSTVKSDTVSIVVAADGAGNSPLQVGNFNATTAAASTFSATNTAAGGGLTTVGAITANGSAASPVTLSADNVTNNFAVTANTSDINVASHAAGTLLTLAMNGSGSLTASEANVDFNGTTSAAAGAVTITGTGNIVADGSTGTNGLVNLNIGSGQGNVIANSIFGAVVDPNYSTVKSDSVAITVAANSAGGPLQVGNFNATANANSTFSASNTGAGGGLTTAGAITANGTAANPVTLSADNVTNNFAVTANTSDLVVQSHAAGTLLTLAMNGSGSLTASKANVDFNGTTSAAAGAVTITGAGNIVADGSSGSNGFVNLNIGSGQGTVAANSIYGCVVDPNYSTVPSDSVSVTVAANGPGNSPLQVGNFNATANANSTFSASNTVAGGGLTTCGPITANGNAANPVTLSADNVTNDFAVTANTSDINVASHAAGTLLTLAMNGSGSLTASKTNVDFNGTTSAAAGAVTITGTGNITADGSSGSNGLVNLNIGSGKGTVAANSIFGAVEDPNYSTVASDTVSVTVASDGTGSAPLQVGNFNATANANSTFTATNTQAGGHLATSGNITANGTAPNPVTLSADNITNNYAVTANTSDVIVKSSAAGVLLTLVMNGSGSLTALKANVDFNGTTSAAAGAVTINGSGNIVADGTTGTDGIVNLNIGAGKGTVAANSILGCVEDPNYSTVASDSVAITVAANSANGDLQVGSFNATVNANSTFSASNTASGGGLTTCGPITANGTVANPVTLSADNVTNNYAVTANTSDLVVASSAPGRLITLAMNGSGSLTASKANVDFNGTTSAAAGAVTITGSGNIVADGTTGTNGLVNLNIGSGKGTVAANSILGCVEDPNYSTVPSDSVSITVAANSANGPLQVGNFNATANANSTFSASNTAAGGGLTTCGPITANGTVANPVTLSADNVTNNYAVTANTSDIDVASHAPGSLLTLAMNSSGSLTASKANVDFNGTTSAAAGAVTITGSGNIIANGTTGNNGLVNLNIGSGKGTVAANSILGCVEDPNYSTVPSDSVSITVAANSANGAVQVGNFNATANVNSTFTAVNTQNGGGLATCGNITANGTALNPVTLSADNVTNNYAVTANTSDLVVANSAPGNLLSVSMNNNGSLTASNANVDFNGTAAVNAGSVQITGTGDIAAYGTTGSNGKVYLNIGSGTANVTANYIYGCVHDPNYSTIASDSVNIRVAADGPSNSPLMIGNFNATANANSTFSAVNTQSGGGLATCGPITANGSAGSPVTLSADNITNNNTVTANTSDLVVSSSAPGNRLNLAMNSSGSLNALKANVDFNGTTSAAAGAVTITGSGNIVADGTTGANGIVNLNIGAGKGTVSANSILGAVEDPNYSTVPSDSVAITVAANSANGALQVGNFNATANANSTFSAVNTQSGGGLTTCGPITANGSVANPVTLSADNITNNNTVTANTSDLVVSSSAPGNQLNLAMNSSGSLNSLKANVDFNGTTTAAAGAVAITGNGNIVADGTTGANGIVNLNIGAGKGTVSANSILGAIEDPNYSTVPSDSVSITVAANSANGALQVGNFNATANANSTFSASNTAAGGGIATAGAITANGTVANPVSLTANNITNNYSVTANTSNLDLQGSAPGNPLSVSMNGTGSLNALKANVNFNGTTTAAAGAVTITGAGNIIADGTTGTNGLVNLNIGSGKGTVSANSILGAVEDPNYSTVPSDSVAITVAANSANGALLVGNFNATANANSTFSASNTAAGGGLTTCGPITANGTVANPVTLSADNVTNNYAVTANTSDLVVASSAAGRLLTLAMNGSGSLTASKANVDFNGTTSAAAGAVTITGSGNIVADGTTGTNGLVNLNIGSGKGTVAANSILGCIEDPNYNTVPSDSVSITVAANSANGALQVGNFNATANAGSTFSATNTQSGGGITTCGPITANGSVANPVSLTADNITNNYSVTANTSNLDLQGSVPGNSLSVSMNGTGSLNALNANVNFNGTTSAAAGAVTITGSGNIVAAGTTGTNGIVNLNIGTGKGTVSANSILGAVEDPNYSTVPSDSVAITVAANSANGALQVGNFNATANGNSTFSAVNTQSGGGVTTSGTITANGTALNPVTLSADNITNNYAVTAHTSDLVLSSSAPGNQLNVAMNGSGSLTASNANVDFNGTAAANAGSVQITGAGNIAAYGTTGSNGKVYLNIGSGTANVAANSIYGCVHDPNYSTIASDTVDIAVAADGPGNSPLMVGNFNATANAGSTFSASNTAAGGSLTTCGNITANGTALNPVTLSADNVTNNYSVTANTGDVNVQSSAGGRALTVTMSNSGNLTALNANVDFNGLTPATAGSVTVLGGNIAAYGTSGNNGLVNVNIGSGTLNFQPNSVIGCVVDPNYLAHPSGSVFITVSADGPGGALQIGNFNCTLNPTSTFQATNTETGGHIVTCGPIIANGNVAQPVTLSADNVAVDSALTANTSDLVVSSSAPGNQLNVSMNGSGSLTALNANVDFNGTAAASAGSVQITGTGNIAAYGTTGSNGKVYLNIGSGTANVAANSIYGCVHDPNYSTVASDSVNITVAADGPGNSPLMVGNFNATADANSTFTASNTAAGGSLATCGPITANGSVANPVTLSADNITNNNTVTANTSDLVVSSSAPGNQLNVAMNGSGSLNALNANVDFNGTTSAAAGAVTITGSGNIVADGTTGTNGLVNLNIGSGKGTVSANSILGSVEDPNYSTVASDSVSITVAANSANGALQVGNFNATANANSTFSAANTQSGGGLTTCGPITANGTVANPVTLSADNITNNNTVTANTSDLVVSSSAPGNQLNVAMNSSGSLNALNANVDLNGTTTAAAGAVTITGSGNIVADGTTGTNGLVNLNIGSGKGTVSANSILGCLEDPNYSTVASDSVSITVAANSANGALQVGNFNATANANSTFSAANTQSGGGLTTCGLITANGTVANPVTLSADNITNDNTVTANTSDIVVSSSAPGNQLNLAMNSSGSLNALNANVDFNGTTTAAAGAVMVTGSGNIVADGTTGTNGLVNLNIGSGQGTVSANSILGAVEDPNYATVPSDSVSITVAANSANGALQVGNFNATANANSTFSAANTQSGGGLTTCGPITANGTVASPVTLSADNVTNNYAVTANTSDLVVSSSTPGNQLDLSMNSSGSLTASNANVDFNGTTTAAAGSVQITGTGNIAAYGTTGSNGKVYLNIGSGTADVAANSIYGCVHDPNYSTVASDSVNITVAADGPGSSPLMIGNFNATANANSTFTASNTATGGSLATCGNITANGSVANPVSLTADNITNNNAVTANTSDLDIQSSAAMRCQCQ